MKRILDGHCMMAIYIYSTIFGLEPEITYFFYYLKFDNFLLVYECSMCFSIYKTFVENMLSYQLPGTYE